MIEELKQLLRQFSIKGWLLYYKEKRKNGEAREQLQSASPVTKVKGMSKRGGKSRTS